MLSIDNDDNVFLMLSLDEKFNPVTQPVYDKDSSDVLLWLIEATEQNSNTFIYNDLPYYVIASGIRFEIREYAIFVDENWKNLTITVGDGSRLFSYIDDYFSPCLVSFAREEYFDNQPA